jgi:NAD(P)-dependent dehydrogenase (short-subunit alcohol dehydrogenase family)
VVTGTGGIGYEVALQLARAGAEVVIAGRNPAKGATASLKIKSAIGEAAGVRFEHVDLASLRSVAAFCQRLADRGGTLDILINNAGIMVPPRRLESVDGFELQLATNYLGHFALTAGLLPMLRRAKGSRVVSVSSIAARSGQIDFADLNAETAYRPMPVYAQSKLACLMFALEFHRRSAAWGWGVSGVAAHPGVSRTDLLHNAPGKRSAMGIARSLLWFLFQPAPEGALPLLYAATAPQAVSGGYYGPRSLGETRGSPTAAKIPPQGLDPASAERLWTRTEQLTGIAFAAGRQ